MMTGDKKQKMHQNASKCIKTSQSDPRPTILTLDVVREGQSWPDIGCPWQNLGFPINYEPVST